MPDVFPTPQHQYVLTEQDYHLLLAVLQRFVEGLDTDADRIWARDFASRPPKFQDDWSHT